jgi:hypothetical protein
MSGQQHLGEPHALCGGRDQFMSALKSGVVLQAFLLVLTACILDGGQICSQFLVALIGYWLGVACILIRRGRTPTRTDLFIMRYGSIVLLALAPIAAELVYLVIGESTFSGLQRVAG